ncbi:MAG: 23S rRNA (adenine(1618)-N(6))-methyltransferase RlmF [Cytophagaceae bacterium]
MPQKKKEHPKVKPGLHPRNKHRARYDFKQLVQSCPELSQYVRLNDYKDESIDFFNPEAVKTLNKALLKHYYDIAYWDIPAGYLCPPIPGRADYIHHIADLLGNSANGKIPRGNQIKCLDVGVGANCIYPIVGVREYGWSFIGSDIDPVSINSAAKIIEQNPSLHGQVEVRLQPNRKDIFAEIIHKDECFDLSVCNPPFHASASEAQSAALRKLTNLNQKNIAKPKLNFGGQKNELWCQGGEESFVREMIYQSKAFSTSCFWFSTLISKQANLKSAYKALENVKAVEIKTLPMGHGNKISRILAWTFLSPEQQSQWVKARWGKG